MTTHETSLCPLGSLKLADYNPREMPAGEMAKLKASIREFGLVQPVVARKEDGLVLGGHQRLGALREIMVEDGAAASEIESAEVPVVFVSGLSDDRAKLLNLALNKISGEWDYARLGELFQSLKDVDLEELSLSGFSGREIDDVIAVAGDPALMESFDTAAASVDLESGLAEQTRRFTFKIATDAEAEEVRAALGHFGMTGPSDSAVALVAALRHAYAQRESWAPQMAAKPKKKRGKKAPEEAAS